MTEKIKSAIGALKLTRDTKFFIPKNEVLELSIRSLNAWSEVLNELEEKKEYENSLGDLGFALGISKAINIINQHLADIEIVENPNGVYSLYNFLKELVEDGTITEKNDNTEIYFQDNDGVMHPITDYSFDQDRELVLWE